MSEFQSMACSNGGSSVGWEFQKLDLFNMDISHSLMLGSSTPPYVSLFDSDISTGYLQDALFEFNSKRRRLLSFPLQSCSKDNWKDNLHENFGYTSQTNEIVDSSYSEGARSSFDGSSDSLSSHKSKDSLNDNIPFISDNRKALYSQVDGISTLTGGGHEKKRTIIKRVVYPFAVVKPGGLNGDMTLNDINKQILMPPTRPVKHPVGDFACRPLVSPHGPGLSGKAVVALTKIQTRGSGTITIIRTKG